MTESSFLQGDHHNGNKRSLWWQRAEVTEDHSKRRQNKFFINVVLSYNNPLRCNFFFFGSQRLCFPHSNHPNPRPTTTTTITHAPPLLPPSSPVGKNTAAKVKTKLGKPEKCLHKRLSDNFSISGFHGNQYGYVCQGTSCARLKQLVRSS